MSWNKKYKTVEDMEESEKARFRQEWNKGTSSKRMAEIFDFPNTYCIAQCRVRLGLQPRYMRNSGKKQKIYITISNELMAKVKQQARYRDLPVSRYLKFLIMRDVN